MNTVPEVKTLIDAEEVCRVLQIHCVASWGYSGLDIWDNTHSELSVTAYADDGKGEEVSFEELDGSYLILLAVDKAVKKLWPTLSEKTKAIITALCMR